MPAPHDRHFAKTTGCRHFHVEFLTFLDALPSFTAVPGISWLARLYFVKDQVSVIGYNEGTIGHFSACLTHMGYSLKPRSWGLRPRDRRFAKTTGCRQFNVEFLTFLRSAFFMTLVNLGQSVRWNLLKNTILSDIFFLTLVPLYSWSVMREKTVEKKVIEKVVK